ncbi:MAG: hypothetical protein JWL72_1828 [Ilumatobacteraceae bacterium]|nr:hypothetical protein [Ilumatobacteraceae bacterium]
MQSGSEARRLGRKRLRSLMTAVSSLMLGIVVITVSTNDGAFAAGPTTVVTISAGQANPTSSSPISFDVTFSEHVTGFDQSDVQLTGSANPTSAAVTGASGSSTYTVTVSGMTTSGSAQVNVGPGKATGVTSGMTNLSSNLASVTYNSPSPPTTTVSVDAGQPNPTSASPIVFDVVFSEPVTGFTSSDVTLTGTSGATTAVVTGASGSAAYTVAVSGMTTTGSAQVNIGPAKATSVALPLRTNLSSNLAAVSFVAQNGTSPLTIHVPADITVQNEPGTNGTNVSWAAAGMGGLAPVSLQCSSINGDFFLVGSTTVTCTATDSHAPAQHASGSFVIHVVDSVAPTLVAHSNVAATTQLTTGAIVTYTLPTATDNTGVAPTVACTPPSGTTFPVGTTLVTCTARDASANIATTTFSVAVTDDAPPPVFTPLPPARLADTRADGTTVDSQFVRTGAIAAGSTFVVAVTGRGGVPNDSVAAALNVTVTNAPVDGFITVFPCGAKQPLASNVNYATSSITPNAVFVALGDGGAVCVFTSQTIQLVVDVNGAFPPTTTYRPIVPARVIDTRASGATADGLQQGGGPTSMDSTTVVQISGRAGVAADASAVVLNVTITDPALPGFAVVYPCGGQRPTASNLNYVRGQTISNLVVSAIGTNGTVCIGTQVPTQVVADVNGWFPATTRLMPLLPARLLDTRSGSSTVDGASLGAGSRPAGSVTVVPVIGRGGVSVGTATVLLNVTATNTLGIGYVTVYPCGIDPPLASNLNFVVGHDVANAVAAKVGADGTVCLFNSQPTDLVVDVNGAFP